MREVTPIADQVTFEQLNDLAKKPLREVWRDQLVCFVNYLISEDEKYCRIPNHEAYLSQKKLTAELRRIIPDHNFSLTEDRYQPEQLD